MNNRIFLFVFFCLLAHLIVAQNDQAKVHFNEGKSLFEERKYIGASVSFTEAISIYKDYIEAYELRGKCFEGMGEISTAIKDYEKVVALDPSQFMNKLRLVNHYKRRKMIREGIAITTNIINQHPENIAGALLDRALFYTMKKDIDKAKKDYHRFLEIDDPDLEEFKKDVRERLRKFDR